MVNCSSKIYQAHLDAAYRFMQFLRIKTRDILFAAELTIFK